MLFLMEETVWCSAGKQLQAYPELAVHTMSKMCIEAESKIDYGDAFKRIMANTPVPMSPLESLASSAVWTAHSAKAALILVLTRGGSTAKLVAKYWPGMPIFLLWFLKSKSRPIPLIGLVVMSPLLGTALSIGVWFLFCVQDLQGDSHEESAEEALEFAIEHAQTEGLCKVGDAVVALHWFGTSSIIKIVTLKWWCLCLGSAKG